MGEGIDEGDLVDVGILVGFRVGLKVGDKSTY
jgi:hypothetical protein